MHYKSTSFLLSSKEFCKLFFFFFYFQHNFVSSPEAVVDSVIELKEGFLAVLHAAWDDGCAKQDSAVCAGINAIAKGKTDIWSFHEEGHLAVKQLAVSQLNMVDASRNSVQ